MGTINRGLACLGRSPLRVQLVLNFGPVEISQGVLVLLVCIFFSLFFSFLSFF